MDLHYKGFVGICEQLPCEIYMGQIFRGEENLHIYFSDRRMDILVWKFETAVDDYLKQQEEVNERDLPTEHA